MDKCWTDQAEQIIRHLDVYDNEQKIWILRGDLEDLRDHLKGTKYETEDEVVLANMANVAVRIIRGDWHD